MGFWTQAGALSFLSLPIGLQKADPDSTLQEAGLVPRPSISPSAPVLGQHHPLPWCRQAVLWGALLPWVRGSLLGRRLCLRNSAPGKHLPARLGHLVSLRASVPHRILCFVLLGLRSLSCAPVTLSCSLKECPLLWSMSIQWWPPGPPCSHIWAPCLHLLPWESRPPPHWLGRGRCTILHGTAAHTWIHTGFGSCLKALLKFTSSLPCFPSILCRSGSCRRLLLLSLLALDLGRVWVSYFCPARWLQVLHKSLCLVSLSKTPFFSAVSSGRAEVRLSDSLITERFTVMLPCIV